MNISQITPKKILAYLILSIICFFIYQIRTALLPFILAVFLAYILNPIVNWITTKKIHKYKITRGPAILIIYFVFISIFSLGGTYFLINIANEMALFIRDIPNVGKEIKVNLVPKISQQLTKITDWLPKLKVKEIKETMPHDVNESENKKNVKVSNPSDNPMAAFFYNTKFEIKKNKNGYEIIPQSKSWEPKQEDINDIDLTRILNNSVTSLITNLQTVFLDVLNVSHKIIVAVLGSILTTVIVLMICAFMLIDDKRIISFLRSLVPKRLDPYIDEFLQKLDVGLRGVVRGQLIICVVNGMLTGIGLFILNVKFALTLSIIATVCSLIPIFGVILSSIPIILMAITQSFFIAILALAWILIVHFIEGNLLNPKIIGKSAEIHPVLVILALVVGEKMYGLVGALLAVPLFSMLQTSFIFILNNVFHHETLQDQLIKSKH